MIKFPNGIEATDQQFEAMNKLVRRFGKYPDKMYLELGFGALMCVYDGLHIGIEKDGETHT